MREYAARNREAVRAAKRKWSAANLEREAQMKRAWDEANRDRKRAASKAWRKANLAKFNAAGKAWKKSNPEAMREFRMRRYGITGAIYDALLLKQGGKCAICRTSDSGKYGTFGVDHDHKTNTVRGLLCTPCNAGLGNFKEKLDNFLAAVDYLIHHGAPGMVGLSAV